MWHQLIAEDSAAGGFETGGRHEQSDFESYLAHVEKKTTKRAIFN
jgi:hypothetical protein